MSLSNMYFTGGWDSTFMLLMELEKGNTVQPIYVIDRNRKSFEKELETMSIILSEIKGINGYSELLLPLKLVEKDSIKENIEITALFQGFGARFLFIAGHRSEQNGPQFQTEWGNI